MLSLSLGGWARLLAWTRRFPRRAGDPPSVVTGLALALASRPALGWRRVPATLAAAQASVVRPALGILAATLAVVALRLDLFAAAGRRSRIASRQLVIVLAWGVFWATVAPATIAADRARIVFLAQADFELWQPGYLLFNDPATPDRRIAYSGLNIPYALMGPGWRHQAVYCNTQGRQRDGFFAFWQRDRRLHPTPDPGIYRGSTKLGEDDYELWLRHLDEERIDTVVVFLLIAVKQPEHWVAADGFPLERKWVREHPDHFQPLLITGAAEIYMRR